MSFLKVPDIVGVAAGEFNGKPCLHVYVKKVTNANTTAIPASVEGYPTLIWEAGGIQAGNTVAAYLYA